MKSTKHLSFLFSIFVALQIFLAYGKEFTGKPEELKSKQELVGDSMTYKGYLFQRKPSEDDVKITIKYQGKNLKEFHGSPGSSEEQSKYLNTVKLFQMIPGKGIQAVVLCSDGGNRETGVYDVLDLSDKGKISELLDSEKFMLNGWYKVALLGDEAAIVDYTFPFGDLDDDDHMFMSRIQVEEIFAYDVSKGEYVPANKKFFNQLKSEIDLKKGKAKSGDLKDVLALASIYWFGGKPKEGWDVFDGFYKRNDKAQLAEKIKDILSKEPYVQAMGN